MHCHEVLGVRENATQEDIECAFSEKCTRIANCKDVLGIVPYERKIQELNTAKKECLEWRDKSFQSRTLSRCLEFSSQVTSNNRVNECCIGPVSFIDWLCGYMCCGNVGSHDYGFCAACCCDDSSLNYTPTIWCDIALYAAGIIFSLRGLKEKRDTVAREYRIRQAEMARTENVHLEEQLGHCLSEQKNIQDRLREEEKLNDAIAAHIALFSAIGTADPQPIYDNQQRRIRTQRDVLEKARKCERELRDKIKSNQRTIDAGH